MAVPFFGSPTAPLRVRVFRLLWLASVVSHIGSFLQSVAASWLMLELTGSALWVGLMIASQTLPLLFLGLPAGALADLVDRRRTLLASQSLMAGAALAMAGMWFAGLTTPGRLLALGLLLGAGVAVTLPAWQALVPDLVPRELLPGAVALNSAAFNMARAVGPALGGVLVATVGPGWAFLLNGLSYAFVLAAVSTLRARDLRQDQESSIISAIALGLRYARFTPPVRWLLLVVALFAFSSAVIQALLPSLTISVLDGGAASYGVLLGAMGAGALVGVATRDGAAALLGRRMVPAGIMAFGFAGVAVALSSSVPLTAVAMTVAGVVWVWTLATLNATTQLLSPAWVRGRLMSLYMLAFLGFLPLGAILAGALGDLIGIAEAMLAQSASVIVLGLVALRLPVPVLSEVTPPEAPSDWPPPRLPISVAGGPVTVVTSWVIDAGDLDEFLKVMGELRIVRLRTGAHRWRLYRDVADPHRMTELFQLTSWEQHLRQHGRIDRDAVEVIHRARAFDRAEGPVTRHLAAVEVVDESRRPDWEQLLAVHEDMHAIDGSVALADGAAPDEPG